MELKIVVMGVGGCGCNTIDMLNEFEINKNLSLIAVNTDIAALNKSGVETKILIGEGLTKGYGAGADPSIGHQAAEESVSLLTDIIESTDILILTSGFGGGTGTGATPFIAQLAKELGTHCLSVITLPFESEGGLRTQIACNGLMELEKQTNACISLSNDLLLKNLNEKVGIFSAFKQSNEILKNLVQAIVSMLTTTGHINVDINDFSRIISLEGASILGVGRADSEDNCVSALIQAINNPLVTEVDLSTAKEAILHIACKNEISLETYENLMNHIKNSLSTKQSMIIGGVTLDPDLSCEIEILLIASGIEQTQQVFNNEIHDESNVKSMLNKEFDKVETSEPKLTMVDNTEFFDIPTFIRQQRTRVSEVSNK